MRKTTQRAKTSASAKAESRSLNIVEEIEDLGTELSTLTEPKSIMDALANRMVRRFGMATAAVWIIDKSSDDSGTKMELCATAGNLELPHDLGKVPAPDSLLGRAITERQSYILSPKHEDEEVAQWTRKHGLKFVAAFPSLRETRFRGLTRLRVARLASLQQQAQYSG